MKELSVFIDESGDFGDAKERPAYYLVTFVFHNQDNDIEHQVAKRQRIRRILRIIIPNMAMKNQKLVLIKMT